MESKTFSVAVTELIKAAPAAVYALLADYKVGHPSILPPKYFKSLKVIQGGTGAGTVIEVEMEAMGQKSSLRMDVTEPRPGKVLQETDKAAGMTTFFRFAEATEGCELTIETVFTRKPGFKGWVESLLVPGITRKIYKAELALIAAHFLEA